MITKTKRNVHKNEGIAKKKITFRFVAAVMVLIMVAVLAVGCKDGSNGTAEYSQPGIGTAAGTTPRSSTEPVSLPEFVYVPETIPLPDGIGQINGDCMAVSADRVYIVTHSNTFDEDTGIYNYFKRLHSMNFDGSDFTELQNYTPPKPPNPYASGASHILSMSIGSDGNLWVSEQWQFSGYDLPEGFDAGSDDPSNYEYIDYDPGHALRKLDFTGAQLLSIDLSGIARQHAYFYVDLFGFDGEGNIYLVSPILGSGACVIYVLDSAGEMLFQLKSDGPVDRLVLMPDGAMLVDDNRLRTIDAKEKEFGDPIYIPIHSPGLRGNASVYPGIDEYDLLMRDSSSLYGFTIGTEEAVKLLDWHESNLIAENVAHIIMLPDGRIMCAINTYVMRFRTFAAEFVLLTKKPYSELPEKTTLTLATLKTWNLHGIVAHFNRTNLYYRIEVIDYTEGGEGSPLNRLSTDIISGKVPDILEVSNLPYEQYIRNGLLEDLYPYFDLDPKINRGDIVEGALRAAEIGGNLYTVFPSFEVIAFIGHPSVVGADLNWTMDEFKTLIDAHPDADMPLGQWLTKTTFLQSAISLGIEQYVDWEKGTVNFDSDSFISLLENANMFPASHTNSSELRPELLFPAGRQILERLQLIDSYTFQIYRAILDSKIAFKGFPTSSGSGISLTTGLNFAIPTAAENKDGAWEFVKSVLDEKRQISSDDYGFPTNKAAFDMLLEHDVESSKGGGTIMVSGDDFVYELPLLPITQEDVDILRSLVDSAVGISGWSVDTDLWNIISEEASNFFNKQVSAQEAARVIQSRAAILVSERS